jgi:hypothetical protein
MIGLPKLTPTQEARLRDIVAAGGAGSSSMRSPYVTTTLAQAGLVSITMGRAFANESASDWIARKDRRSFGGVVHQTTPTFERTEVMLMALAAGLTVAPNDGDALLAFANAAVEAASTRA